MRGNRCLRAAGTPYLHALQFDRHRLVQVLGISFTVSTVALGVALAQAGEIDSDVALPSVVALAASLLGSGWDKRCAES